MKFLKNIPTNTFTVSAFAIGLILIDDLTPAEQNSVGNWFMLIGQVLATNASQQQVINNATNTSNTSNSHIVNDNQNGNSEVEMMEKIRDAFNQQIDTLKK